MNTFKIGDKVKLVRKAKTHENGWENSWEKEMDQFVGQTGTVVRSWDSLTRNIDVKFDSSEEQYGYPDFVLEKVQDKPAPVLLVATTKQSELKADRILAAKFKIGDKVRAHFIDYGSKNEGKTGEVVALLGGYVKVKFGINDSVNLFPQRLTLIESMASIAPDPETTVEVIPAPKPIPVTKPVALKVGDRVQVTYGGVWDGPGVITSIYGSFYPGGTHIVRYDAGYTGGFDKKNLTKIDSRAVEVAPTPAKLEVVPNPSHVFVVAYMTAVALAKQNGSVNADQVQEAIAKKGFTSGQLGNAAGALFRSKSWVKTGTIKSTRPGNNSRTISTWKYVGA